MTTNESLSPLIAALSADELDSIEIIFSLKPLMTGPAFEELALAFDMCPIHLQDLDSCADDDTDNDENDVVGMKPLDTPPLAACRHFRSKS